MYFYKGFEKNAGLLQRGVDKLKGLFTGKKYLYHGTDKKNLDSILNKGLQARSMGNGRPNEIWTTTDKDVAKRYGDTLLKIKVPKEEYKANLVPPRDMMRKIEHMLQGVKVLKNDIKPEHINLDSFGNMQHMENRMKGIKW